MKNKKLIKPLIVVLILGVVAFLVWNYHRVCVHCWSLGALTPESIKNYILGFGSLALFVYIALYAVNTISLLPPIGIMSLAAGFIFGPFWGSVGLMAGSFLGTSATFFISRYLGGRFVNKIVTGKAKDFQEKLNKNGFKVILFIRLIPILPWEVVNYASGLSKIKYRDYIIATLIGIFPAVVIQTFFSDRLSNFNIKDPTLLFAIGAFVLLGAVPAIYLKLKKKRAEESTVLK